MILRITLIVLVVEIAILIALMVYGLGVHFQNIIHFILKAIA